MSRGAPLLERGVELERISALLDAAKSGGGGTLLIEAAAGLGKTRLLQEACDYARERGVLVCAARPTPLEREFAFAVVRQLLEPEFRRLGEPERRKLFSGAATLARRVLVEAHPADPPAGPDATYPALHGLYWATANLSERSTLLLVVDDAHWADSSSLRALRFLVPRIDELRIALLVAARAGEDETGLIQDMAADEATELMTLGPLSRGAVSELATTHLHAPADADFVAECHRLSGGNPFFTTELLKQVEMDRTPPTAAGLRQLREAVPQALAAAIVARLARVGPDAGELARAVAVLGDGASLRHCCAIADLPRHAGSDAADRMVRAGILADQDDLGFVHPLVHSAVYDELGPQRRAALHARAAKLLRAEGEDDSLVAAHLLRGHPAADAESVAVLRRAARRAVAAGSYDSASGLLRRALAEPPGIDQVVGVLVELGAAEVRSSQPDAAAGHLEQALRCATDQSDRVGIARELARARVAQGRFADAVAELELAADTATRLDRELALRVEADLAAAATLVFETAPRARRRMLALAGDLEGASPAERVLLAHAAWWRAFTDGTASEVAELARRALGDGRLLAEETSDSPAIGWATAALMYAGALEEAQQSADRALDDARRRGSAWAFSIHSLSRTAVGVWRGNLFEAEADVHAGVSAADGMLPYLDAFVIHVLVERGDVDGARAAMDAVGLPEEVPPGLMFTALLRARAQLRLAEGDLDAAIADLREARRRRVEWAGTEAASRNPTSESHGLLPLALHLRGATGEALAEARAELDAARHWGAPCTLGRSLRVLGNVSGGADGVALIRQAVDVLEGSGAELELACALVDLGAAMRRLGQRAESREHLTRGMELAHRCGACGLADRAREELRATGARPRREVTTGVDALTTAELRVARMARSGMSNPEIAQALFVTRATVESQLRAVYRKLDIKGRGELANFIEAR